MAVKPNFTRDPGPRTQNLEASSDVLFVGRLSPEKGVGVLLEAWKRAELRGLRLLVIGDGPTRGDLEREAAERADIVFLGRVDASAVSRLMLQARALVVPSIWFEAPLTILEAFASGLPVLASALGPMIDYVGAIGPQWLFAAQDPINLAEALQVLRQDDAVTAAGRAARHEYEASFTPAAALSNLIAAYERAQDAHGAHR